MSTTIAAAAEGIDLGLTEEQELLRGEIRRFAEERIRPGLAERDERREFPADLVRELGQMGVLGLFVPERRAMHLRRPCHLRGTEPDHGPYGDEARPVALVLRRRR